MRRREKRPETIPRLERKFRNVDDNRHLRTVLHQCRDRIVQPTKEHFLRGSRVLEPKAGDPSPRSEGIFLGSTGFGVVTVKCNDGYAWRDMVRHVVEAGLHLNLAIRLQRG